MKTLSAREFPHEVSINKEEQCLIKLNSTKSKIFDVCCNNEVKGGKEERKESLDQYKCSYCLKTYTSITRYEVHLRTHTGEKPYKCIYCEKKFNENGNLKAHMRIHTGERPFKCIFDGCILAFKTKGQLNDHFNRHSNLRPFKCHLCSSAFNRNNRLKIHMMIHSGEKPFQCTYESCCKYFRERGNLMSHLKKHHKKEKKVSSSDIIKESCLNSTSSNNDSSSSGNEFMKILYNYKAEKNKNDFFDLNELNFYTCSDNQEENNN